MMKKLLPVLFVVALLPSMAQAAVTVTATQSGADSGSVMAGKTFTVTASGWSGSCTSAYLDLTSCGVCSVSESQSKSVSGTSVSWTTVTAASKASSQSVSVSISGTCTPDSGSASFDVKNPPALSGDVSPTTATVTQGSSFSISLNIQNTGETTARFGTVSASPSYFTATGCTPSDIPGGQSAAVSCTVAASASATTGAQTMTLSISPSNGDSLAKSVSVTVNAAPGGSSPGGPSGNTNPSTGGAPPGQVKKEEKNVTGKFAPPGLVNNTKLLAAIEKVLAKGKMNQNAVDNLVEKSNIIMGVSGVSRTITVDGGKSTVKTTVKYKGTKTAKNYVVYEKIPKSFANSSSLITITAPGAKVEVVKSDPEYAIVFDTVSPNQDLTVTYSVNSAVATTTVDSFASEVYAESLEEPAAVCAQVITPAQNPATGECKEYATPCDVPAGWTKVDSCPASTGAEQQPTGDKASSSRSWTAYIIAIIVIIIAAAAFYYLKMRQPVGF